MNQTFEARMQAVEDELKEIRKELEESLARYNTSYKQSQYPFTNGDTSKFRSGQVGDNTPQFVPITIKEFDDGCKAVWEGLE